MMERNEGECAFERGESRWGGNPYSDRSYASFEERRRAREWEDGHMDAERRAERKREDAARELQERRHQYDMMMEREAEYERREQEREDEEAESSD